MPRYVLIRHECPPNYRTGSHWDLLLEHDGALLTWAINALPASWGGEAPDAGFEGEHLPPHRLECLEYEGPVSGDRGEVWIIAKGEFEWLLNSPDGYEAEFVRGDLSGRVSLTPAGDGEPWRLRATRGR